MGKKYLSNLACKPLAPTSSPSPTFPRNLPRRCHFDFGSPCATSMCSMVSPAPQQGPTRQTLNASRSPQPVTPKAFQNLAEGQPRPAGASPSDTSQPRRPDPQGVPQWSSYCAAGTGFGLELARMTSGRHFSAFTIQNSAFALDPSFPRCLDPYLFILAGISSPPPSSGSSRGPAVIEIPKPASPCYSYCTK